MDSSYDKIKILVVEDNKDVIESLEYLLEKEGFYALIVGTKKQAIEQIKKEKFDRVLVDVQLPDGTGFEICKYIKKICKRPIIIISARTEESNIVYGLDIGADDYIVKPFGNNELISRIRCVLRRYPAENRGNSGLIEYGNIKLDLEKAKAYKNLQEIYLTNLEYKIMLMFMKNANKIVTREQLLEKVWDVDGNFVNDNTLSVYVKRLREKVSTKDEPGIIIKNVRGIGYIMEYISD